MLTEHRFDRDEVIEELARVIPLARQVMQPDLLFVDSAYGTTCRRMFIAGSIRRKIDRVKDVELVCVPYYTAEGGNKLLMHLDDLLKQGRVQQALYTQQLQASPQGGTGSSRTVKRWGEKMRGVMLSDYMGFDPLGIRYEIYMATPENFGYIYLIRTGSGGPDGFSAWVMRRLKILGYECKDGHVSRRGQIIPTPEESDVLKLARLPLIPAKYREEKYIDRLRQRYPLDEAEAV